RQAAVQFDVVAREYADVRFEGVPLGPAARQRRIELATRPGRPAQPIAGNDLDGRPMKLADYRGRVVLLTFWADWSGYSRQEYRRLEWLAKAYRDRPFTILGVACDDTPDVARRAAERAGFKWRSWPDRTVNATAGWGVDRFPCTFLIDADGVIRY